MSDRERKIAQHLREAHSMEEALTSVLTSQIAMTPRGGYRNALQSHLRETRDHAKRVQRRLSELEQGGSPVELGIGLVQGAIGQALALGKAPLDLLRGGGREEKLLRNARDDCATEALEIATYTAIEQLARSLRDTETASLATSIRGDEEKMLDRLLREIPALTEAIISSEVRGEPSRATQARASGSTRSAARTKRAPRGTRAAAKRGTREARDGAKRSSRQPARANSAARAARSERSEPWPGYEAQRVDEIASALDRADDGRVRQVRSYEREHKNRSRVLDAAQRELMST
jgi:ferritin-like metal-binding protein YciE